MKLIQLLESNKSSVTSQEIFDEILSIHGKPEDFDEGDLTDRIYKYDNYRLTTMSINNLDLEEWDVDEDYVEELVKKNIKNKYFPIVVEMHSINLGSNASKCIKVRSNEAL